jgi:hypothetical protein
MIDFSFSEEETAVRDTVRSFVDRQYESQDVVVPASHILGEIGKGPELALQ